MASDLVSGRVHVKTPEHESLIDNIDAYEDTTPRKVISKKICGCVLSVACLWKGILTSKECRRVVLLTPLFLR